MKPLYIEYMKDSSVLSSASYFKEIMTGGRLELNSPWADVDYVIISILPTNKVHWMLALLNVKATGWLSSTPAAGHIESNMIYEGVQPFYILILALMKEIGIWSRASDLPNKDQTGLRLDMADSIPQQLNGHDCGIFVIEYALYLLHANLKKMPKDFDAKAARMDITATLFKYRQIRKNTEPIPPNVESIVIDDA